MEKLFSEPELYLFVWKESGELRGGHTIGVTLPYKSHHDMTTKYLGPRSQAIVTLIAAF